ncbi:olfactory protein-like isoform X2 [Dendropsophus ebraccatus]|uniref:olfactory protein-like isoform X2 n=1 Tax=Dendropsophus ebraccatus TaxID=150705 RepID=UPI0038322A24
MTKIGRICLCSHVWTLCLPHSVRAAMYAGRWYGIIAASNCPMFNEMKKGMKRPLIVYATDGHTVKNSVAFMGPKGCQQMDFSLESVSSGHYKYHSPQGDNEVIMVGSDYHSFSMEFMKSVHDGKPCMTINLNGRGKNVPDDIKKQFIDHIKEMGLTPDDTFMIPDGDECIPKGI